MTNFKKFIILILIACSPSKLSDVDISDYQKAVHYYNLKNYDSAIYYFKNFLRKVPRYKEISDTIINAHLMLASSLENKREYEIELLVYNELLKYVRKNKNFKIQAEIYLKMSNVYEKMGLKEQAVYYRNLYSETIRNKF